jgi:chemotaxis protein MotB
MARVAFNLAKVLSFVLLASSFGCGDKLKQCQQDLNAAQDRAKELQGLYDQAERARVAAEDEITALKADRDRLKGDLAKKPEGWDKVPGGALINIQGDILFDSGKAELLKEGTPTLEKIADAIKKQYPNHEIYVFGHTDNEPITKSGWKDNYELSCQRSLTVLRFLKLGGVQNHMAACGWGETRPAQGNDTKEGMQANRRVQIFAMDPKTRGK